MLCKGTRGGWLKYPGNPVLGGELGTCFDVSVVPDEGKYRMYFSWRPKKCIGYVESDDGIHWSTPIVCIEPMPTSKGWQDDLNRPCVIKHGGKYHMWYTGQFKPGEADGSSHIFYATSEDGIRFSRAIDTPVLYPETQWEKSAVMNPDVMWDPEQDMYRIWYSAGEQYEPNAIGYATSHDGITWTKNNANPVFCAAPENDWEKHKVAGCHVIYKEGWYFIFYIGYQNEHYAQIGLARSRDGVNGWERHPQNPIIAPDEGNWDQEACYKPYAIEEDSSWKLWYNGRTGLSEQIGMAFHNGLDLGF